MMRIPSRGITYWSKNNLGLSWIIHFITCLSTLGLKNKLIKNKIKTTKEIREYYWIKSSTNKGIKTLRYKNSKFSDTKQLLRFSYDKPHLNLGINWILRIRSNFENSTRIVIASKRVTPDCPRYCPCCGCGNGKQSFFFIGLLNAPNSKIFVWNIYISLMIFTTLS